MEGKIIKGIGGFYYIHTGRDVIYSCRAAGIFRKLKIKPLPGDNVSFEVTDEKDLEGSITAICERKNTLIRPAAANVDQAMVVFSAREPDPSLLLLDRFLIYMSQAKVPVIIYLNKTDLDLDGSTEKKFREIYENAGYPLISGSTESDDTIALIRKALKDKTTVLAGPSGVGKSSLTNKLCKSKDTMEVGELSKKIKRGKQTTRHTELFNIFKNTYILDTPGFASLYTSGIEHGELDKYFNEFKDYMGECRFSGCSHIKESDDICAVKRAVAKGLISRERYEDYCLIYDELKDGQYR